MINIMDAEVVYLAISVIITILVTTVATIYAVRATAKETQKILREITYITSKVAVGMKASALMHGWKTVENVTDVSEIEKIAEEYEYDPNLKICYYKPRKSGA